MTYKTSWQQIIGNNAFQNWGFLSYYSDHIMHYLSDRSEWQRLTAPRNRCIYGSSTTCRLLQLAMFELKPIWILQLLSCSNNSAETFGEALERAQHIRCLSADFKKNYQVNWSPPPYLSAQYYLYLKSSLYFCYWL